MNKTAIKLSIDTDDVSLIKIKFHRNQLNVPLENEVGDYDEFAFDDDLSNEDIQLKDECIMDGEGSSATPLTPESARQEFIDSVMDDPETAAFSMP